MPGLRLERIEQLSHGARGTGNRIVQGENLAVLSQLEAELAGDVRCVYIDPPYNNQERYTHYDDASSHEAWLASVVARVVVLERLLRDDGSIWISIDDREVHHLKVAIDRALGREKFVATIVWEQRTTRENRKTFSNNHEYVLVYAKRPAAFRERRNRLPASEAMLGRYRNRDDDPRGPWQSVSLNVQAGHGTASQFYALVAPSGRTHSPPDGRCWVYGQARMAEAIARNDVWFGRDGNGVPRLKRFLSDASTGLVPETLWRASDVGTSDSAKKHLLELLPDTVVFDTPKPEALVHRILHIATDPGELVLDAYLGSGTTAAAAHKTGRRYLGIERGDHAATHCAVRMERVIAGERGGISEHAQWRGGGGLDFFRAR